MSTSQRNPTSLFKKLRIINSPTDRPSDIIDNIKVQRLRLSSNEPLLRDNSDFLSPSVKYDEDIVKHKSKSKRKKCKNMRYSNQDHDDSDDPDVPSENLKDLSSVELNNEHDDSSSMSHYQTVPKSVQMIRSKNKNFKNISSSTKENNAIYGKESRHNDL